MPAPWPKGTHTDYSAFVLEVYVRKDKNGGIRSFRSLQNETDEKTAQEMEGSHGMQESAWALLTEAARSEVMLQLLVKLTHDPEFMVRMKDKDGYDQKVSDEIQETVAKEIGMSLEKMLPKIVDEALRDVHEGLRGQGG